MPYYEFEIDLIDYAKETSGLNYIKAICKKYGVKYIDNRKQLTINLVNQMIDISNMIYKIKDIIYSNNKIEANGGLHYLRECCEFLNIRPIGSYTKLLKRLTVVLDEYKKRDLFDHNTKHFSI